MRTNVSVAEGEMISHLGGGRHMHDPDKLKVDEGDDTGRREMVNDVDTEEESLGVCETTSELE